MEKEFQIWVVFFRVVMLDFVKVTQLYRSASTYWLTDWHYLIISVSTWRMRVGIYNSLQTKETCKGSYWRKTLLGKFRVDVTKTCYKCCCYSIKSTKEVEKVIVLIFYLELMQWDFHLTVYSWRVWQVLYHCLQLENAYQSPLPDRHPHVQIWRLWQNIPYCTQVKSTREETSGWPKTIQMWDGRVWQSVFRSWNFDITP